MPPARACAEEVGRRPEHWTLRCPMFPGKAETLEGAGRRPAFCHPAFSRRVASKYRCHSRCRSLYSSSELNSSGSGCGGPGGYGPCPAEPGRNISRERSSRRRKARRAGTLGAQAVRQASAGVAPVSRFGRSTCRSMCRARHRSHDPRDFLPRGIRRPGRSDGLCHHAIAHTGGLLNGC
jgi:hypothetical protein